MTAEFAAVLPAVVLVLAFAVGALQLAGEQVRLQAAVSQVARSLGRGDAIDPMLLTTAAPGASFSSSTRDDLVCAEVRAPAGIGILSGLTLTETSCALDDGR